MTAIPKNAIRVLILSTVAVHTVQAQEYDDRHMIGRNGEMSLYVTGIHNPTFYGKTTISDGTNIVFLVKRPFTPDFLDRQSKGLPACDPDCMPADVMVTVKQSHFESKPIAFADGGALAPGSYQVEAITTLHMESQADLAARFQVLPTGETIPSPFGCNIPAGLTNGC